MVILLFGIKQNLACVLVWISVSGGKLIMCFQKLKGKLLMIILFASVQMKKSWYHLSYSFIRWYSLFGQGFRHRGTIIQHEFWTLTGISWQSRDHFHSYSGILGLITFTLLVHVTAFISFLPLNVLDSLFPFFFCIYILL